jgi:hypothetical protein
MNTTQRGDRFEAKVHRWLSKEVGEGRFFVHPAHSRVYRRKAYWSSDREADVIVDLSIESTMRGQAHRSLLILVECKDYASSVPVNDVEELLHKMKQIGAAKGIIITTTPLQRSARKVAAANGVAWIRLFPRRGFETLLPRVPNRQWPLCSWELEQALTADDLFSLDVAYCAETPGRITASLQDVGEDLVRAARAQGLLTDDFVRTCGPCGAEVPYLREEQIELSVQEVLACIGYVDGAVPLERLCELARRRHGLRVVRHENVGSMVRGRPMLGGIKFDPLEIHIWADPERNLGRCRFTEAHELGHYFLEHGAYFRSEELVGDGDTVEIDSTSTSDARLRLEWQANAYAARLLMPTRPFVSDFVRAAHACGVFKRGHRYLYADSQPCNFQSYRVVMNCLTSKYQVSATAADLRLRSLDLLVGPGSVPRAEVVEFQTPARSAPMGNVG